MNAERRTPRAGSSGSETRDREERLRAIGQVTGELLHDLGGLIAVLAGRVALAREEAALGRTPADELARIQADTDEIRRMVLEVLDELKGVRPALEVTFPVEATLERVVNRWLVGTRSVATTLKSSLKGDAQISGPRSFFSRAIGNLLRNAARHAHSEVRLSVRSLEGGASIEIRVEDDGDGIPPELSDRLFEPFVSTSGVGAGLGLSFARWGIERLRGTLTVDADPSALGGACFRVTLPLSTMTRHARARTGGEIRERPAAYRTSRPLEGLKVMVVDDDPAVRRTFSRLLLRSGAEVADPDPDGWASAEEAAGHIREEAPGVVLLDVHLRGLSAREVYAQVERVAPELSTRIVYFTGGGVQGERLERPVLSKMMAWDDLVASILEFVRPG